MDKQNKKMIAPIVITCIIVLYYLIYFLVCALIPMPLAIKLLFGLVPLLLIGVCIYVLVQRIQEIRSGEEDDLSKY